MKRTRIVACGWLALSLSALCACSSDPNLSVRSARTDARVLAPPYASGSHSKLLDQDSAQRDPEQQAYARISRQRLRAIESRAQALTARPQAIAKGAEGDAAATLNLLPSKCDETEREIEALEMITSPKWQHRKHTVDSKLANLERSLDRAQSR